MYAAMSVFPNLGDSYNNAVKKYFSNDGKKIEQTKSGTINTNQSGSTNSIEKKLSPVDKDTNTEGIEFIPVEENLENKYDVNC